MSWLDRVAANAGVERDWDQGAGTGMSVDIPASDNAWKYISAGDIKGLGDYTDREYSYKTIPYVAQAAGHAGDAIAMNWGNWAQFLGAEGLGNFLYEKAKAGEEALPETRKPELSLSYIIDPNGLTSAAAQVAGSMLSMAPVALFAPVGGLGAMGAAAVSNIPRVGLFASRFVPGAVRWAATGPVEAMMEGGGTERELLENGASRETANQAAWDVFKENAALLTATNALEGGLLGKLFGPATKSSSRAANAVRSAVSYAPQTAAEALLQGYEEGAQEGIQAGVMGKGANTAAQILNPGNWTEEQWDAAKFGFAGGLPLVGGAALMRRMGRKNGNNGNAEDNGAIAATDTGTNSAVTQGVNPPDEDAPSSDTPAPPVANDASANVPDGLTVGYSKWAGQRMDNGSVGCVEAVTKIGCEYSPFLAQELEKGNVYVPTLVQNAGDMVIPFSPEAVERGDVIVYGNDDHVVIADGEGGYVGNSSSQEKVVHGTNYMEMDDLQPTKIIKTGGGALAGGTSASFGSSARPVMPNFEGLIADENNIQATQEAVQKLIDTDSLSPEEHMAIIQAAEMARDTPVGNGEDALAEAEHVNEWQSLIDRKDAKGIFEKDPQRVAQAIHRLGKEQRVQRTRAAIENQQQIEATKQALQAAQARQNVQGVPAQTANTVQQVVPNQGMAQAGAVSAPENVMQNPQMMQDGGVQTMPQNVPVQNVLSVPAADGMQTGTQMTAPQVNTAPMPMEVVAAGMEQSALPMPQQVQTNIPQPQNVLGAMPEELRRAEAPLLTTPAYAAARRRGDWGTAAQIAAMAQMPQVAQYYRGLGEQVNAAGTGAVPNVQQGAPRAAGTGQSVQQRAPRQALQMGAQRVQPHAPVVGVRPNVPATLPTNKKERAALGRALGRFLVANKIMTPGATFEEQLVHGHKKAIMEADKKIAKWEKKRAKQERAAAAQNAYRNTAQTAQEGAQAASNGARGETVAQRSEDAQNASETVRGETAQNEGNKKAADNGDKELADGYETESGRPLSEADPKEFIIKPNGSRNFGEITKAVSDAVIQQSGVSLGMGEIRLRVGNEIEGLIHAKAHTAEAKQAGYSSVEELIADVAQNFNQIYMREPDNVNGKPTYSLVKTGNKKAGIMNGVAPVYFELQSDNGGNYYIVVTAMPKGDTQLARQTKRDRLIYSSPGLGAATVSGNGAVSHDGKAGAANRGGSPTSDKSDGLSTSTIPSEAEESKEKPLNEDEREAVKGLSADAKNVYRLVRDKLSGMKNKAVQRAASVSAVLLSRHADVIARKVRAVLGRPFTAMDYYNAWIALQYGGEAGGLHQTAGQSADERLALDEEKWNALIDRYDAADKNDWRKNENGNLFPVMDVPLVLQLLNIPYDKIHVFGSFFGHSVNQKHKGMTLDLLRQLPRRMADPLMVTRGNKPGSYVFVVDLKDSNGATIVVPVEINKKANSQGAIANVMNTAFGKTVSATDDSPSLLWFQQRIQKGDVLYLNKNKSTDWLQAYRNLSPAVIATNNALSAFSISNVGQNVKTEVDLEAAREANPGFYQRAYHGTPHDFDAFDLGAIGTGEGAQAHGYGLYFAGNRSTSEGYKERLTRNNLSEITLDGVPFEQLPWDKKKLLSFFDPDGSESELGKQRDEAISFVQERLSKKQDKMNAYQPVISFIESHPQATVEEVFPLLPSENSEKEILKMIISWGQGKQKVYERTISSILATYKQITHDVKAESDLLQQFKELDISRIKIKQANKGKLFEVEIPDDDVLLDEQKPFDEQTELVQEKLVDLFSAKDIFSVDDIDTWTLKDIFSAEDINTWELAAKQISETQEAINLLRLALDTQASDSERTHAYADILKKEYADFQEIADIGYDDIFNMEKAVENIEIARDALENSLFSYEESLEQQQEEYKTLLKGKELARIALRTMDDGRDIYNRLSHELHGDKAASLVLNEVGIKGITYDGRRDGRCYVIFDDKAISIIEKFNQQMNAIIKGTTTDTIDGQRIISLFESADETTALHELGHLFLLDLERLAPMSKAGAEDLATVKRWAAWSEGQLAEYKDTPFAAEFAALDKKIRAALKSGNEKEAERLKRQWEHERFARGFEMYLKHGDAPTKGLRAVFAKFRAFLQRVYQAFTGTGGRATPEVEAVMARMISIEDKSDLTSYPRGKETKVYTDSGKALPVQYRVVSADDLIASHMADDMTVNPGYPAALQPRDRERVMMRQQVDGMAGTLRPEDLADARNLNQGAPLIRSDGVVLNGNGRTIAIRRAQKGERGAAYRDYIMQNAEAFGLKKEDVAGVENPVLVREVQGDVSAEMMQDIVGSTTGGSRMGASENAQQDAGKVTYGMMDAYVPNDKGDITSAANRRFVAGILHKLVGKDEMNAYLDKDGHVNADGIQRVKRALFALAYGDDELVAKMSESSDDDIRNVSNGLMTAAPLMARLPVKKGALYVKELQDAIGAAVKQLDTLRRSGESVKDYLSAQALFAEHEDSNEMRLILDFLDANKRSGKRIATFFSRVARTIDGMEEKSANDLFETQQPSLMEVLEGAKAYAENGGQEGLFGDNAQEVADAIKKKQSTPMSDAHSPERNVQNDSADTVSSGANISPNEAEGKQEPTLENILQLAPALKKAALEYGAKEGSGKVTFADEERKQEFLKVAKALLSAGERKFSVAWHGSPFYFDSFSLGAINSGEGAQAHGYGLYFARNRETAESYRGDLSGNEDIVHYYGESYENTSDGWMITDGNEAGNTIESDDPLAKAFDAMASNHGDVAEAIKDLESELDDRKEELGEDEDFESDEEYNQLRDAIDILKDDSDGIVVGDPGRLFKVEIPDEDVMLDEDLSYDEQPTKVKSALKKLVEHVDSDAREDYHREKIRGILEADSGRYIYDEICDIVGTPERASKLLNKFGIEGIAYDGQRDGRCYVIFDDNAIDVLETFSARRQEALQEMLDGIRLIPPHSVSPRKRVIADWGREMGVPVVFFKGDPHLHGYHSGGVTFLNVDSEITPQWTFWHEAMHWMRENNPDIYNELVRAVSGAEGFTKEQLDAYRREIGAPQMSDADVVEEMLADALPDVRRRVPLLREIGKRDTNVIQRFVAWVHDVMRRFHDHFHTPKGGLTTAQRRAMVGAFGNLVGSLRDADGKPIFRIENDGARITLRDGSRLPAVKYSLDNAGKEGDNEGRISDAVFQKYLNDGIMEMVRDKVSAEIGEHIDTATMRDPIARDAARDRLPYIRQMLTWYNQRAIQENPAYKNRMAAKIEYARRCFDNDPRIQHGAVRPSDRDNGQGGIHQNRNAAVPENDKGRGGSDNGRSTRGVSRGISGERAGAHAHFEQLYEDMRRHLESQGAFSTPKFSANTNGESRTGNFKWLTGAIRSLVGVAPADNLELPGRVQRTVTLSPKDLEKRIRERWIQEKNIISKEVQPNGKIKVTYYPDTHDIGLTDIPKSVRQVAKHNPFVKILYDLARKAMRRQEQLRNEFGKALKEFSDLVKKKKDLEKITEILQQGDVEGEEYTDAQLREMDASENVIKAYRLVRREFNKAYKMLNEARMQVRTRSRTMAAESVETFKKSHWIKDEDVISVERRSGGKVLLTWRGCKTYETEDEMITADALELMKKDENIIITRATPLSPTQYGEGMYEVDYVERIKPIHRLTGYMPHFFHEWMIYEKIEGPKTGVVRYVSVDSGRTMNEAVKIGNKIAKDNADKQYVLRPKGFDLGVENSVVIGDMDFAQMSRKLAKSTEVSLADARSLLLNNAGASLKSRHRFFGNMMKRTGAKGFDEDVMWVLAHYLNGVARYVAMEGFKPPAISMYERFFGRFDDDPKSFVAKYCKDFINDVNGNPRWVEKGLNELIKRMPIGKYVTDKFGDRVALALNGELSTWNAITKLGLLNVAAMTVNFSQFINVGAALNDYSYAAKGLKRAVNPSEMDEKIIEASGILGDINAVADNGGYTQRRRGRVRGIYSGIKHVGELTLIPFQWADMMMRKAAVLGAYYQGVEKMGMKTAPGDELSAEAIAYAQEINDDANWDYSSANAPWMMRAGSVVTQQMFQFMKYPIMQAEFMYNILFHGTRGQKVRFFVPYVLFCGIPASIPFGDLLNQLFSFLFGFATGDDKDIADEVKAEVLHWAGKDPAKKAIAETAIYGVLAPTFGIDVSQRIGMSGAFGGGFYGKKPESVPDVLVQQLGGPAVNSVINWREQMKQDNPVEALKAISPALGNMVQAYVTGVSRTTRHRVNARYDTVYDKLVHAFGFRSVEESKNSFITNYEYEQKSKLTRMKQEAIQEYINDPSDENRRLINALGITKRQIEEARIQQERTSLERATEGRPKTSGKGASRQRKEDAKKGTLYDTLDDE